MENKVYLFNTKNYFTFVSASDKKAPCVVILPGGGYDHTSNLESFNVAKRFTDRGIHACVINYREEIISYPEPQKELAYTIDYLRKVELVIPDKIICIGFSAGGHLALSNACFYKELGYNSRPNYLVLCYPVISSKEGISHKGSFNNLLMGLNDGTLYQKMSLEDNLPEDLPPVFLWHTVTDKSVPVENSLKLMEALSAKHLNYEAHLFPQGCHGMSLADSTTAVNDSRKADPYVARWTDMMFVWLEHIMKK